MSHMHDSSLLEICELYHLNGIPTYVIFSPDYEFYDKDGVCIKCTGPGASMTEDGVCTCDGDDFSIMSVDEEDQPTGLCVCDLEASSFVTNNVCRTCTGVGKLVEDGDDYQCVCGNNAALTWETIGYVCTCNPGFPNIGTIIFAKGKFSLVF